MSKEIKDVKVSISLANGKAIVETSKINGFLEGCFIKSENPVNVKIYFPDNTLQIYDIKSFKGNIYLPLRIDAIAPDGKKYNHTQVQVALNNSLIIEASGSDSKVEVILRYC